MKKASISTTQVRHIATLANITVADAQLEKFAHAFDETLEVVNQLQQIDVTTTEPTHQVTGLENVWREDTVKVEQMFTPEEALANAAQTHQGFFVVPQVIDKEE